MSYPSQLDFSLHQAGTQAIAVYQLSTKISLFICTIAIFLNYVYPSNQFDLCQAASTQNDCNEIYSDFSLVSIARCRWQGSGSHFSGNQLFST